MISILLLYSGVDKLYINLNSNNTQYTIDTSTRTAKPLLLRVARYDTIDIILITWYCFFYIEFELPFDFELRSLVFVCSRRCAIPDDFTQFSAMIVRSATCDKAELYEYQQQYSPVGQLVQ